MCRGSGVFLCLFDAGSGVGGARLTATRPDNARSEGHQLASDSSEPKARSGAVEEYLELVGLLERDLGGVDFRVYR